MSMKVGKHTNPKAIVRAKRRKRIRAKLEGTAEKPRLAVFRSNKHLSAQLIDDVKGHTIAAASSSEEDMRKKPVKNTIEGAKTIGQLIAKRALAKSVAEVVFDRSGYLYHGRVKAFADAAREAGLKF